MRRSFPWLATLPLVLALPLAACGGTDEGGDPSARGAEAGAMDGLTPEQIRQQAESMTPAVAESLGIVDTTIHVEPAPGDTAPPPDTMRS